MEFTLTAFRLPRSNRFRSVIILRRLGNPYPEKDSYTTVQITPAYWTPDDGYQTGHFVELRGYGAVGNNSNTLNSRIPMDEVIGWAELPDRSEISFAPITSELCQKSTT